MINKKALFLALTTASPWLLTGCEDSGESAKPPIAPSTPVEQAGEQPTPPQSGAAPTLATQPPAPAGPDTPALSDQLIREAERAGWTIHKDETGNILLTPPEKSAPGQ